LTAARQAAAIGRVIANWCDDTFDRQIRAVGFEAGFESAACKILQLLADYAPSSAG
jgi:hypothetical protein